MTIQKYKKAVIKGNYTLIKAGCFCCITILSRSLIAAVLKVLACIFADQHILVCKRINCLLHQEILLLANLKKLIRLQLYNKRSVRLSAQQTNEKGQGPVFFLGNTRNC